MSDSPTETTLDFALVGHPDSYTHLKELFRHSRPDYSAEKLDKYEATISKIFEWTPSYLSQSQLSIPSPSGKPLHGGLIICTFLPESIGSARQMLRAREKTIQACDLAAEHAAQVVGLGGFTSIVAGAQGAELAEKYSFALTSGNSLTAGLALEQLDRLLDRLSWDLHDKTVAVIGASGDIGRACTFTLAPRSGRMLLLARNQAKLESLKEELGADINAQVSTEVRQALEADLIVAATSSAEPILEESDLKAGTIVCDIGYPKNFAYAPNPRSDVLVFSAGLAQMPFELDITFYTRLPEASMMYGCYSEAMILALADRRENFSSGQGQITQESMNEILGLAAEHNFQPAPLYRGKTPITDDTVEDFLELAHKLQPDRS